MTQRLDELTSPVEIGKYYLVPTVTGQWYGRTFAWPIIGPRHSDAHCLNFDFQHYHLDPRFLYAGSAMAVDRDWWRSVAAAPLMVSDHINKDGLPKPVLRKRKCWRDRNPFAEAFREDIAQRGGSRWKCHFDEWTGRQARHDGRGWVCPHRAVPLADHAPVDGVITCPLHMLRIDAATGEVLSPLKAEGGVA